MRLSNTGSILRLFDNDTINGVLHHVPQGCVGHGPIHVPVKMLTSNGRIATLMLMVGSGFCLRVSVMLPSRFKLFKSLCLIAGGSRSPRICVVKHYFVPLFFVYIQGSLQLANSSHVRRTDTARPTF